MIATLKAFFLGRLLREKAMLVVFLLLGAAIWFSSFARRAGAFRGEFHRVSTELAEQKLYLENKTAIEAAARAALSKFEESRTLDATRLTAELQNLARQSGLANPSIETSGEIATGQFAIHTVSFSVRGADWEPLRKFYTELTKRTPYIGIESFQLAVTPDRRHNLAVKVSSVEIIR